MKKSPLFLTLSIILFSLSFIYMFASLLFLINQKSIIIDWTLLNLRSINISYTIVIDWISLMFLSVVSLISSVVFSYCKDYMKEDKNINRFLLLVFLFVLSMNFLIISPNLVSVVLGWDGLGLTSYILVIYYSSPKSEGAGMLTVLSNRIGDSAILISIGLAMMVSDSTYNWLNFCETLPYKGILPALVIMAAMTKSAQIPFSAWLPAAMAAPTPVSSLVHSSTLVTAGIFLMIRFAPLLYLYSVFPKFLLLLGTMTMTMASLAALQEIDFKKIIALSTLSQLGVMVTALGLAMPLISFFHLITHAMFKALLFLCAGILIHTFGGSQEIRSFGANSLTCPLTLTCLNLANLSLCGLPFMSGFFSKDMILENLEFSISVNFMMLFIWLVSLSLTAFYSFRLFSFASMKFTFSSPLSSVSEPSFFSIYPLLILSFFAMTLGCSLSWLVFSFPQPLILPMNMKILVYFLILSGVFLGLMNNMKTLHLTNSSFFMKLKIFPASWITPSFWGNMCSKANLLIFSMSLKISEPSWSEMLGGQGAKKFIFASNLNLQILGIKAIEFSFSAFLVSLMIFLLF